MPQVQGAGSPVSDISLDEREVAPAAPGTARTASAATRREVDEGGMGRANAGRTDVDAHL